MKNKQSEEVLMPDEFMPDYSLSKEDREKQKQEWREESRKAIEKLHSWVER